MSKTLSMMPVVSAHCSVHATWRACSTSAAASPTGPTTASAGTATSSKRTSAKRRTRSRPDIGVTVRPAAPAGTRTWLSAPSCSTATSRWSAWAPASTGEQVPESTKPSPSGRPPTGRAPHQAATRSPASSPGSTSAFWSGEPTRPSAPATTLTGTRGPGATTRPISSATSTRSSRPCSENEPPPSASGTSSEVQPSCAPCAHDLRVVAQRIVLEAPDGRDPALGLEEPAGRVDEEGLLLGQLELHGRLLPTGSRSGSPPCTVVWWGPSRSV